MVSDRLEGERWRRQLRSTIGAGPTNDRSPKGPAMSSQYDTQAGLGRDLFGAADLGDRRRTARLVRSFDLMCRHPGGTLPGKLASPQDLRGLYHLCDRDVVT